MTRLTLLRPHTHAGRTLAPGDRLELPSDLADWLIAEGVARPAVEPARREPEPKPSPRFPSSQPEISA